MLLGLCAPNAYAETILFIGSSFADGAGTRVMTCRAHTVTDLNGGAMGGVPALFNAFAVQAGLDDDVATETHPGVGIDWHLAHSLDAIGKRRWDSVVLQSDSTLEATRPGDAALLIDSVGWMSAFLKRANRAVTLPMPPFALAAGPFAPRRFHSSHRAGGAGGRVRQCDQPSDQPRRPCHRHESIRKIPAVRRRPRGDRVRADRSARAVAPRIL